MRDYKKEFESRVQYVKDLISSTGVKGIVYGNSGGKDCSLVSVICKAACDNTVGVIMPCASKRNYGEDTRDALEFAEKFNIETRTVDLTPTREALIESLGGEEKLSSDALANINPRLRMTTLYAIAAAEGRLVAGTGNRSERYMGYFTKWGDGACDFNVISDLTVREVYEFLAYLGSTEAIMTKAPSAALFEGQTDEDEMGVTYAAIDDFLLNGTVSEKDKKVIDRYHSRSDHKRRDINMYKKVD